MDFPTPKDLKKLADTCRKAGIKSFKYGNLEFTLADEIPESNYKKSKQTKSQLQNNTPQLKDIPTDTLTEEQLLYYSVGMSPEGMTNEN